MARIEKRAIKVVRGCADAAPTAPLEESSEPATAAEETVADDVDGRTAAPRAIPARSSGSPQTRTAPGLVDVDSDGLQDVLVGADAGLALFDREYRLLACNALYVSLCGLAGDGTLRGITLMELIRLAGRARGEDPAGVEVQIDRAVEHLKPGRSYTITHQRLDGSLIEIRRTCLVNGSVVEAVREAENADGAVGHRLAELARTRLDLALDVMSDGFTVWDQDDRLVMYNRRFIALNPGVADIITPGISYPDLKGRAVARGLHDVDGQDRETILAELLQRHADADDQPHEMQLADGRWILVRERRTAEGAIVGTRTDITELKQRELALTAASREVAETSLHFDTALENMVQGLCMFDADNTLIVTNRRYLEMYGFDPEIVRPGATLREILEYSVRLGNYTPEQAARALSEREARSTLRERTTVKQHLKDGRIIAVMNEPMSDGGTIATYQDITESERAADELRRYTEKLEISNRELQDFAYVASHDLQEPLRKIEAFGDRLSRKYADALPEQGQLYIERMQDAASRMRTLINDLLGYSRVTTKAKPFEATDLGRVMAGVLSDLSVRIEEQRATIEVGDLPTIRSDATQMRQLLQNLLSNALKFVREGVDPVVRVDAVVADGTVHLTVADNGIGFDNQFKDQIFTIFQRLHGRLEYEGTGVGLATTRKIVERHRGAIDADGRPGEGATFHVSLPMAAADPD